MGILIGFLCSFIFFFWGYKISLKKNNYVHNSYAAQGALIQFFGGIILLITFLALIFN